MDSESDVPDKPEVIAPIKDSQTKNVTLMDVLMTAEGKEIAKDVLVVMRAYAEAQAKWQFGSTVVLALVIIGALAAATYLSMHDKFDGAIGTLVGTLVGFLVGRKSATTG